MKYEGFKDIVRREVTNLLANNEVTLSQKRNATKLMELYLEFVKSDKTAENLIRVVKEFITKTKGKDRLGVRNVFISVTKVKKYSEKEVTVRKSTSKKGGCKLCYEYIGRGRLMEPSDWINAKNKELKRRKK